MKKQISPAFFSKDEYLLNQILKAQQKRRLKFWSRFVYLFLISLLGGIIYLSFVLKISSISLFSGI